jgi:hypothetical protein
MMLIVVLALPMAVQAQEAEEKGDPVTVTEGHVEAVNSGDAAAANETMAENATVTVPQATTSGTESEGESEAEGDPAAQQQVTGTAETQAYLDAQAKANANTTLGECSVAGETVTCAASYTSDALQAQGIDFLEGQLVVTVVEGKIQSYDFTPSAESVAKIQTASAPATLPVSGGTMPDTTYSTYSMVLLILGLLLLAGVGTYAFQRRGA